jgi:preprotein translocase subunit SecF
MRFLENTRVDFVGNRTIPFALSALVLFGSLGTIAMKGFNYSIEFSGGTLMQVSFKEGAAVTVDGLRKALAAAKLSPELQSVEGAKPTFILREKGSEAEAQAAADKSFEAIKAAFPDAGASMDRKDMIGPVVGKDLKRRTLWAIVLSLLGIVVYVAFRFDNPVWGLTGVLALAHDVIGTAGLFSALGIEVDLLLVTALLTIAGYSINDTIVIFDRMRENMRLHRGMPLRELINLSVNETLSRTIITVLAVQMVCLVLLFAGGPVIRDFALAMVVGNILGSYSTIGVAAHLVFEYYNRTGRKAPVEPEPAPSESAERRPGGRRRR